MGFSELQAKLKKSALTAYGAIFLVVAAGYAAMHLWRPVPVFPVDDAYITLHSAQVLHWGSDPNYPGVSPLYGVTSAPFLALIYLLLFALSPLIAIDAACWIGVLAYAFGLVRLARMFHLSRLEAQLWITLGLIASFVPFSLINGLETSWALACVTWTLALSSDDARYWNLAAFAAGLTASIRPDLLPFTMLVLAALIYQKYRANKSLSQLILTGSRFVLLALLPILACALWYYHATGTPFPLTGVAKRYFMAQDTQPWTVKLRTEGFFWVAYLITCGPLILSLPRVIRYPLGKAVLLFFAIFLAALYMQFPQALIWNWFRYPIVLIPMMLWAMAMSMDTSNEKSRQQAGRLLRASVIYSLLFLPVCLTRYIHECHYYDGGLHDLVAWSNKNLPPHSRLMLHDAGYVAYATNFRTIDIAGLKTPEAVAVNRAYTWPSAGVQRAQAVSKLAMETGAEYLIVQPRFIAMGLLPEQLRALGWRVDPMREEGVYRVFRLTPPVQPK